MKFTTDPTETTRRQMVEEINHDPGSRPGLENKFGQVWDTDQLGNDFSVTGFMAPFVVVKRRSDGKVGTLTFQHDPRFYFSFEPQPPNK